MRADVPQHLWSIVKPENGTRRHNRMSESSPIAALRVGVSSCLLGQKVRYDRGHKRDRFLTDELGPFVDWVPVCPEVESGLGLPRPTMHLAKNGDSVVLIETKSGLDHTRTMEEFTRRRARELRELDLSGYVLKKDSPSCGMTRVKVRNEKGMPDRNGVGVFCSTTPAGSADSTHRGRG